MFPDSAKLSTVKLLAYALFQRFVGVPKLYVSEASGTIFDVISALIVIESVSESPIVMLPSALMFPVACMLPCTSVLPIISTTPVPLVTISKF